MRSISIYGLTGGIGSGKTEAANRFRALGFPVVDADAVGHEMIAPGGPAERIVKEAFGDDILTNGRIDRDKLATIVFSDAKALETLNKLVHPAIFMAITEQCQRWAGEGRQIALVDAALLAEHGRKEPFLTGLILVTADDEVRKYRLMRYRGLNEQEANRRMAAQTPQNKKLSAADWIIDNSGTLEDLHIRVDRIAEELHRAHG